MMVAYRAVVAHREDLTNVTLICDGCGTGITLNIETARIPQNCGSCGMAVSENISNALAGLGRFHRHSKTAEEHANKQLFRFDIKQID
jgi:hypothetical protein